MKKALKVLGDTYRYNMVNNISDLSTLATSSFFEGIIPLSNLYLGFRKDRNRE